MEGVGVMSEREAREVLAHFTEAPEGRAVMDGDGQVWTFRGGRWVHRYFEVDSVTLARALCPDLADEFLKEDATC